MDGDEEVHAGSVRFHGFLVGGFIDVGGSGVHHVDPTVLEDLADSQSKGERVVFFLPAVIDGARITSSVAGVKHD